jgi:putative transposase
MARPSRNSNPNEIARSNRTFFATTRTAMGHRLLQSGRNATLLIDVLRSNIAARKFRIHDFVIMRDHVHLLLTVRDDMTIEKAMQLIKGGFSYRLKKEFGYLGEIWQKGFSEVRVNKDEDLLQFRKYIALNPVKAGLVDVPEKFPYCFSYLARHKQIGAKATIREASACGMAKAIP